jgi:hypothetical protein
MKTVTKIFVLSLFGIISNSGFGQDTVKKFDQMEYLLEEEKLARDLYTHFYELYGIRVFGNIKLSEQKHMELVQSLLEKEGSDFTTLNEKGKSHSQELQELYDKLIKKGTKSQLEALKVGKLIEETDIKDLKEAKEQTNSEYKKIIYSNLIRASENHLNAFNRWIDKTNY